MLVLLTHSFLCKLRELRHGMAYEISKRNDNGLCSYLSFDSVNTLLIYMIFDGFDLGLVFCFHLVKNEKNGTLMMGSIVPVWDSNETWLLF